MSLREIYLDLLQKLLPTGQGWTREPEADLTKVLNIFAFALSDIHARADDVIRESDPRSTVEMFNEWETEHGLPDSCTGGSDSITERRMALIQKIISTGGQSRPYFISIAEALGYEIGIVEYRPFQCGLSECGVVTHDDTFGQTLIGTTEDINIRFFWNVKVSGPRVTWFQCGLSECGKDPQAKITRADDLECILQRLSPAQTDLIFTYQDVPLTITHLGQTVTHMGLEITV